MVQVSVRSENPGLHKANKGLCDAFCGILNLHKANKGPDERNTRKLLV